MTAIDDTRSSTFRHVPVVHRSVDDDVVVARPHDGLPMLLNHSAASVWRFLDQWRRIDDVERHLRQRYPDATDPGVAAREVIESFEETGLLERSSD